ncbi:hypothetical protein [Pseudacidobacterium ailaaui]|uniref:hypothetical protein n=1 Tax=Pseudacidobacterium ailaaui TaxID=1382359 RepID=UPI0012DC0F63|nr:hypothetical protein [Pseudacidobacterium ailaaui]
MYYCICMGLSPVARILWATGFIGQVALLLVLCLKNRWRIFRFFTAWVIFQVIQNICGFYFLYTPSSYISYKNFYWSSEIIDLFLQVCVILEMARIVLRPTGTWVRDALRSFLTIGIAGILIAGLLSYLAKPHGAVFPDAWIERGSLFSAMLSLELFIAMAASSTNLGLVWRNHVMGLATGWSVWAIVDFFVEGAYSYLGPHWHGIVLDQIRIVISQATIIYWAIIFWLPEPKERTLSPEMQKYLISLHHDVQLSARRASSLNHH